MGSALPIKTTPQSSKANSNVKTLPPSSTVPSGQRHKPRTPHYYDSRIDGREEPDQGYDYVGFNRSVIWKLYSEKFTYVPRGVAEVTNTKTEVSLVSQLCYWFTLPLQIRAKINDRPAIYRSHQQWANELHATRDQVIGAIRSLKGRDLIVSRRGGWGKPPYYTLVWDNFPDMLYEVTLTGGRVRLNRERRGVSVNVWHCLLTYTNAEMLVLAQLDYWFAQGDSKKVRAKVQKQGCYWVYKTRQSLARETGLTKYQAHWALRCLERRGILVKKQFTTRRGVVPHFRIDPYAVEELLAVHDRQVTMK